MQSWNEDLLVVRHSGIQANALSVDVTSRTCVLGSRRHLTFFDLANPAVIAHKVSLSNKWDINHVRWNSNFGLKSYFLTTYNQYCDLWDYNEGKCDKITTFSGHTRSISDIDWSLINPNCMATCSMDTYFNIWDIRDVKKPQFSTSTVYGASQVKWNKFDENCIATAHDGNIRLWDIRNGKSPLQYITAHLSKINSLDWSPTHRNILSSGSQDTTIRFWNIAQLPVPMSIDYPIKVQFPVWKSSYTPFGSGMVSVSVLNYRETPLSLWNCRGIEKPKVHTYSGHTDVIQDYQWCKSMPDGNWQLVTWCKDQALRFWKADYSLLWACGAVENIVEEGIDEELEFSSEEGEIVEIETPSFEIENKQRNPSTTENFQPENYKIDQNTPKISQYLNDDHSYLSLKQEFKLINYNLPHLRIPKFNLQQRTCIISLHTSNMRFTMKIYFPSDYPNKSAPHFQFIKSNIEQLHRESLLNILNETAQRHVKNSRRCLEPCLRELTTEFAKISYTEEPKISDQDCDTNDMNVHWIQPNINFSNVPFPRTSGARFCSVGYLVIFMRPSHIKGFHSSNEKTPRSIANLFSHRNSAPSLFGQGFFNQNLSRQLNPHVSSFYYKEKRPFRKLNKQVYSHATNSVPNTEDFESAISKPRQNITLRMAGQVVVFDLTRILPISKVLAKEYIIPGANSFKEDCFHNKIKASQEGMTDLTQLWSCVAHLPHLKPERIKNEFSMSFAKNPLGSEFMSKILDHYSRLKDVQTLAMLSVTFNGATKPSNQELPYYKKTNQDNNIIRSVSYNDLESQNNQNKIHKSPSESKFPHFGGMFASIIARSPTNENSFLKAALHHSHTESVSVNPKFIENQNEEKELALAKSHYSMINEQHKDLHESFYCDVLDQWKMNIEKLEFLKASKYSKTEEKNEAKTSANKETKIPKCYICELPIKGRVMFCMKCFHGGHVSHVQSWFKTRTNCPYAEGCDCQCGRNCVIEN